MKGKRKRLVYVFTAIVVFSFGVYALSSKSNLSSNLLSAVKELFKSDSQKETQGKAEDNSKETQSEEEKPENKSDTSGDTVIYSSNNPLNNVKPLLDQYDYKMKEIVNIEKIKLPASFKTIEDDVPVGINLAMANEVSKSIGFDFSPYLGKETTSYTISVNKKTGGPEERLVLLMCDKIIIGCWAQEMNFYIRSLNGKLFEEIIGCSWDSWVIKNDLNKYYGSLSNTASPEELIRKYFQYINSKQYHSAFALFSRFQQVVWLYFDDPLHDKIVPEAKIPSNFFFNITSVTVKSMACENSEGQVRISKEAQGITREFYAAKYYVVESTSKLNIQGVIEEKPVTYYIQLIKESANSPWKIDSIGTNLG